MPSPRDLSTLLRLPAVPLLTRRDHAEASVFRPESLLREARRQKRLPAGTVPPICLLDPDGDVVAQALASGVGRRSPVWACYHTELWEIPVAGGTVGVVARAVGGSFAVLIAEQLFASGCQLLISLASAGQITDCGPAPYFVLIERALRDEGTSYHYLPPADAVSAPADLVALAAAALADGPDAVHRGTSWTTDAPFRETASMVAARRTEGVLTVEMESAALYAFAAARDRPVLCFAYVTNQLGCAEQDFEKGEANGAAAALRVVGSVATAWHAADRPARAAVGS